jgi:hypothetical protein
MKEGSPPTTIGQTFIVYREWLRDTSINVESAKSGVPAAARNL